MNRIILSTIATLLATSTAIAAPDTSQATRLKNVQTKGNTDIATRLTSLSTMSTRINATTKLTTAQKGSLTNEINGQISGLNTLKSTLDTDTDLTAAKADFARIFSEHYIYAFYTPRVDRILAADGLLDAADKFNTLATSLDGYITQAKDQGSDTTALTTSLTEMKAKVADAQTQANNVITNLTPLTAAGYPSNKTTIATSKTSLVTARNDLKTARTDAGSIVTGLKKLISGLK